MSFGDFSDFGSGTPKDHALNKMVFDKLKQAVVPAAEAVTATPVVSLFSPSSSSLSSFVCSRDRENISRSYFLC